MSEEHFKEAFKAARSIMRIRFEEDNYLFNSWVSICGLMLYEKGYISDTAKAAEAAQEVLIKAFGMDHDGELGDE